MDTIILIKSTLVGLFSFGCLAIFYVIIQPITPQEPPTDSTTDDLTIVKPIENLILKKCPNLISIDDANKEVRDLIDRFISNLKKITGENRSDFSKKKIREIVDEIYSTFESPEENQIEIIKNYENQKVDSYTVEEYVNKFLNDKENVYQIDWGDSFKVEEWEEDKDGNFSANIPIIQFYRKTSKKKSTNPTEHSDFTEKNITAKIIINPKSCEIKLTNISAIKAEKSTKHLN